MALIEDFRPATGYIDRILRGAKPGKLAVQAPTSFELFINLKSEGAWPHHPADSARHRQPNRIASTRISKTFGKCLVGEDRPFRALIKRLRLGYNQQRGVHTWR